MIPNIQNTIGITSSQELDEMLRFQLNDITYITEDVPKNDKVVTTMVLRGMRRKLTYCIHTTPNDKDLFGFFTSDIINAKRILKALGFDKGDMKIYIPDKPAIAYIVAKYENSEIIVSIAPVLIYE